MWHAPILTFPKLPFALQTLIRSYFVYSSKEKKIILAFKCEQQLAWNKKGWLLLKFGLLPMRLTPFLRVVVGEYIGWDTIEALRDSHLFPYLVIYESRARFHYYTSTYVISLVVMISLSIISRQQIVHLPAWISNLPQKRTHICMLICLTGRDGNHTI